MNTARFINAFLYPDFTTPTDIRFVLDPYNIDSDDSASTSSTNSDIETDNISFHRGDGYRETLSSNNLKVQPALFHQTSQKEIAPCKTEVESLSHTNQTICSEQNSTTTTTSTERMFPRVSFTTQASSDTTTSPLDDMDLIDIILKHGVHRELKSLTFRKECVQEPPSLSPVKECSDDTITVPVSKMLHFDGSLLDKIKLNSLGCFLGKNVENKSVLPIDGLTCMLYLLYSEQKNNLFITSSNLYGKLDLVQSQVTLFNTDERDLGKPIGVAFASYLLSENTPIFILELAKSKLEILTKSRIEFFSFIDVGSENLILECFECPSNKPMVFNVVDGNH